MEKIKKVLYRTKPILNWMIAHKKMTAILVVVMLTGLVGFNVVRSAFGSSNGKVVEVNEEVILNGRDSQGNFTEYPIDLKFISAEKKSEVLIQGQRATARNEKIFMIIEIALTNESDQVLYLNPIDLVRWIDADQYKISPQVNQGNLEVRPQSTKKSNLGFVVPENDRRFDIQVGEIDGDKHQFTVEF